MTLRVAQFFLKIAHLSFSMGPRGSRAYGLRPRLWLLVYNLTGYFCFPQKFLINRLTLSFSKTGHEAVRSEKLLRLLSDRAQTLHNDRTFYSKQWYRFCFFILTVFDGEMTSQC